MLAPYRTARGAWLAVNAHGNAVTAQYRVARVRQFAGMISLGLTAGLSPESYYKFSLFHPERRPQARQYTQEGGKLLKILARRVPPARDRDIFSDKRAFARWCGEHGLPCARNLETFEVGEPSGPAAAPWPAADLLSKPTNLKGAKGVMIWRYVGAEGGEPRWLGAADSARPLTGGELRRELHTVSARLGSPIILQPFLRNHPELRDLGNGSLATVRLISLRFEDTPAESLLAVLKIPLGDMPADNFHLGGLAADVDIATGRLGRAAYQQHRYPIDQVTHDPGTGAPVAGRCLPLWDETRALALRAHDLLASRTPIIGWDIAITADGPVLVECNNIPCNDLAQIGTGRPLGSTRYAACLVSHLKAAFSTGCSHER